MKSLPLLPIRHLYLRVFTTFLFVLAAATTAGAATDEDSLVCAKVKDSYAVAAYTAAFWPRSAAYGEMTWCNMRVLAVEHCVPVMANLLDTTAPWDGYRGPDLTNEYTCYRIRCVGNQGASYMGSSITLSDSYGTRSGGKPRVTRVCIPDR